MVRLGCKKNAQRKRRLTLNQLKINFMRKPRVAIVGSGISGMSTAYFLQEQCDVHIYEQDARIGGHTATIDFDLDGVEYSIDTGFIVFNDRNYPLFRQILHDNKVDYKPTSMGFSVSCDRTGLEYCGNGFSGLFAQTSNLFSLAHWQMLRDIVRFNKIALEALEAGSLNDGRSLNDYLIKNNFRGRFVTHYLIPMASAIWSKSTQDSLDMPVLFFLRFFKNHGLLSIKNRPQWYVIDGGSKNYIPKITQGFAKNIHCNSKVTLVKRYKNNVDIIINGKLETFDHVVFACHSDQALKILENPTTDERSVISKCLYNNNEVVLHWDESQLPSRKSVWSSWNYKLLNSASEDFFQSEAVLTYNMNILQGLNSDKTFCATLNCTDLIDENKIIGTYHYAHPTFSLDSVEAQSQWNLINKDRTWFCGAWWGNGFHEDGVASAKKVADKLLATMGTLSEENTKSETLVGV